MRSGSPDKHIDTMRHPRYDRADTDRYESGHGCWNTTHLENGHDGWDIWQFWFARCC